MQSKRRWVLLVDDHEDSRELMTEFLSAGGFDIESCASGEQALERIGRDVPSAVITDLSLEGMSGAELAKRLRTNETTAEVPILAVTGHAGYDDRDRVFTEVLVKPVALDELTAALRRVVPV
jgi:CheY-like chemotaxis protein